MVDPEQILFSVLSLQLVVVLARVSSIPHPMLVLVEAVAAADFLVAIPVLELWGKVLLVAQLVVLQRGLEAVALVR